jgi:hypothetical protein
MGRDIVHHGQPLSVRLGTTYVTATRRPHQVGRPCRNTRPGRVRGQSFPALATSCFGRTYALGSSLYQSCSLNRRIISDLTWKARSAVPTSQFSDSSVTLRHHGSKKPSLAGAPRTSLAAAVARRSRRWRCRARPAEQGAPEYRCPVGQVEDVHQGQAAGSARMVSGASERDLWMVVLTTPLQGRHIRHGQEGLHRRNALHHGRAIEARQDQVPGSEIALRRLCGGSHEPDFEHSWNGKTLGQCCAKTYC